VRKSRERRCAPCRIARTACVSAPLKVSRCDRDERFLPDRRDAAMSGATEKSAVCAGSMTGSECTPLRRLSVLCAAVIDGEHATECADRERVN
jgi:hypothetical protein